MRSIPLLLAALLLGGPLHASQEPLRVVATIPDLGSMAESIGGDAVEVTVLVKPGQNPHAILAKPSMLLTLSRADVLLEMGMSYEHAFLPAVLAKCRNEKVLPGGPGFMNVSAAIEPLEVPKTLDRGQGADLHPRGNPHFNIDPVNGRKMARLVFLALQRADPGRAALYERNWQAWDARAVRQIAEWEELMAPLRGAALVTYHRSWSYLAARYGLRIVGEVEPKPGLPPSAGHIRDLARTMVAEDARVILIEPWYNENTVAGLLRATGARLVKMPVTCGLTPETRDYLDYIDHLLRTLASALESEEEAR